MREKRTIDYGGGYYDEKTGRTVEFQQSGEYVRRLVLRYEPSEGRWSSWKILEAYRDVPTDIRQRVLSWRRRHPTRRQG